MFGRFITGSHPNRQLWQQYTDVRPPTRTRRLPRPGRWKSEWHPRREGNGIRGGRCRRGELRRSSRLSRHPPDPTPARLWPLCIVNRSKPVLSAACKGPKRFPEGTIRIPPGLQSAGEVRQPVASGKSKIFWSVDVLPRNRRLEIRRDRLKFTCTGYRQERSRWGGGRYAWA